MMKYMKNNNFDDELNVISDEEHEHKQRIPEEHRHKQRIQKNMDITKNSRRT